MMLRTPTSNLFPYTTLFRSAEERRITQPAQVQQRSGGVGNLTDLRVVEPVAAKMRALAHDQAHQQRAAGLGQCSKLVDEVALGATQQVAVTLLQPCQGALEVVQVIKRLWLLVMGYWLVGHTVLWLRNLARRKGSVTECMLSSLSVGSPAVAPGRRSADRVGAMAAQ